MKRFQADAEQWREKFEEANETGSRHFGTLWLAATTEIVSMLREAGYGDAMEGDYRLRAGLSRGLYRTLCVATLHPNNLSRGKSLIALEATAKNKKKQAVPS